MAPGALLVEIAFILCDFNVCFAFYIDEIIVCRYAKVIVFFHSANINRNNIATFAIGKEKIR